MHSTAAEPSAAPCTISALRHGLPPHDVVALGGLDTEAREQLVLPIDLYMLTARGDDEGSLELQVSMLRTRPLRFVSRGGGLLAYALLTPAGALKLLRGPLRGGERQRVALAELCGADEVRALRADWLAAPQRVQRVRALGHWIEARLGRRMAAAPARVAQAATWLQHHGGLLPLHALCRSLAVSTRQLERDFHAWLGMLPSAYARLVRFQQAAGRLAGGARLAEAAGDHYCDQSHLHRGMRAYSSLTPRQFAALARLPARRLEQQALAGRVFLLDAPALAADHRPLG